MKYIGGNIYLNRTMKGSATGLAILFGLVVEKCFNARIAFSCSFLLTVLGGIPLFFFNAEDPANTIIVMGCVAVSTFGLLSAFMLVYLINPLVFPAVFCSSSLGTSNISARMMTILAPLLAEWPKPLPMLIYCILASVGFFLTFFIRIPDDMESILAEVKDIKSEKENLVPKTDQKVKD